MIGTTRSLMVAGFRGRGGRQRGELPDATFAYLLTLPALLVTLALLAYPLAYSFWLSLHQVTLGSGQWVFVGLQNYVTAVNSPLFVPAVLRTVYFTALVTVATTVLGLAFAMALSGDFWGRNVLRGILILPWSLSQIMLALTFGWIYNSTFGPLNGLLYDLHLIRQYIAWFADGTTALNLMAVAFVWSLVPFSALLFLGALQTVPVDLLKAAQVDGAGVMRRFWLVTLPWIRETLQIVIIIATLNGFLAFALIYILTGGGPGTDTTVLSWWGYTTAFQDFDLGQGAAIFYIMTLMVLVISILTIFAVGRGRKA